MDEITEHPDGNQSSESKMEVPASVNGTYSKNQAKKAPVTTEADVRELHLQNQALSHTGARTPVLAKDSHLGFALQHRMHRSAVRPFLCCGSELSLVSLMDNMELKDKAVKEMDNGRHSTDTTLSHSDSEENSTDCLLPYSLSSSSDLGSAVSSTNGGYSGMPRRLKADKHKSKKRFWNLRFGGRWPQGLRFSDTSSHEGCTVGGLTNCSSTHAAKDSTLEAGAANFCSSPCLQPVALSSSKGRSKSKNKKRRASALNVSHSHMTDLDGGIPINGNEELLARERGQDVHSETRVWPTSSAAGWLTAGLGTSATPPTMALMAAQNHEHLPHSDDEESVLLSELSSHFPWPNFQGVLVVPRGMTVHTQVDYIHYLVPDLRHITNCSFYWGVIDRFEAERLLDKKREGTFLLRDSAQEEFLFSVSFRRYNRSLHARIEQWNHRFSFDVHDPAVFSSDSVCGLIEHYKDSSRCLFFEPMLTDPMHRNFPFSLQHLARAVICSHVVYDSINFLPLPNSLKEYIRYYHYKQKVCIRRFDYP